MRWKGTYTQRKPYFKRTERRHTGGKGLPYVYNNKVYLGKKPQTGSGAISRVVARLLENVGDVIGL